jgi:CubicO group peptidase (beta-lactamase class C family)
MKNYRILPVIMIFGWIGCLSSCGQPTPNSKKERIEALLDSRYKPDEPGAAIVVTLNGKPLIRDAYGMADLEKNIPLTADHSFAIGSVSKQFTAAAILLLHQQGKLSIHDEIGKYFPEASNYPGVRIHQLLTHSAGIMDLFLIEAWSSNLAQDLSREETLNMIFAESPEFAPGENSAYSNSGYYLLGVICEKVSNTTLNQFLKTQLFEPLQMNHTTFLDNSLPEFPSAIGYEKTDTGYEKPFEVSPTRFFAGGSVITTIDDMLKWDKALYSDILLSGPTREILFEPVVSSNNNTSRYACGWEVAEFGKLEIMGHGGGINGYVSQVYRIPEKQIYVALMSNVLDRNNKAPVSKMAQLIIQILLEDQKQSPTSEAFLLSPEDLQVYEGNYLLPNGSVRRILTKDGKLFYEQSPGKETELKPQSRTSFKAGMASTVIFIFAGKGQVESLEIHTGTGRKIVARKEIMDDSLSLSAPDLFKFTGTYRLNDRGKEKIRTIECREEQLFYVVDKKTTILLLPVSRNTFRLNESSTYLHFKIEEDLSKIQLNIQKGSGGVITGEKIHMHPREK